MTTIRFFRQILFFSAVTTLVGVTIAKCVVGFSPTLNIRCNTMPGYGSNFEWKLNLMDAATEESVANANPRAGGVGLAQDSAIKIVGDIEHGAGNVDSSPEELLRYNNLKTVDGTMVQSVLGSVGSAILCSGQGVEDYKDPGQTANKEVDYAPMEAIKDALSNVASVTKSESLVFNFLGGDDLILGEVLEAGNELVLALNVPASTKVSFNSISHKSIPATTCTVTVVAVGGEPNDSLMGVEKSVAEGEIYTFDGTWYTVEESDINTSVE